MEQFKDREAFDAYWNENYVPLSYKDVQEEFENYVKEAEKHIFLSDYEESGSIAKADCTVYIPGYTDRGFLREESRTLRNGFCNL